MVKIGTGGLYLAIILALVPDCVKQMIRSACVLSAALTAEDARDSVLLSRTLSS